MLSLLKSTIGGNNLSSTLNDQLSNRMTVERVAYGVDSGNTINLHISLKILGIQDNQAASGKVSCVSQHECRCSGIPNIVRLALIKVSQTQW